jgi:hypothetical protein
MLTAETWQLITEQRRTSKEEYLQIIGEAEAQAKACDYINTTNTLSSITFMGLGVGVWGRG